MILEGAFVVAFVLVATFGPFIVTSDPNAQDLARLREGPNPVAPLGRDELGRDVLTRLVFGARYTIGIGFVTVGCALLIGGSLGVSAGFVGGWLDEIIMRCMDVLLALPSILLALGMIAILGTGLGNVIIAVSIGKTPALARLLRGVTLKAGHEQFVEAARAIGGSELRIVGRHILPNIFPYILVQSTYTLGEGVLQVAGLGFLGLGVQPPTAEWGSMLSRAREVMFVAPHIALAPGVALVLLLLSVNLFGDALRDVLDPRIRHVI